jgi:hypothetical protein
LDLDESSSRQLFGHIDDITWKFKTVVWLCHIGNGDYGVLIDRLSYLLCTWCEVIERLVGLAMECVDESGGLCRFTCGRHRVFVGPIRRARGRVNSWLV